MNPVRWSPKDGVHAPPPRSHPPARRTVRGAAVRALALVWAAGLPALAVAQSTCPPPPAIPDSLLRQKTQWSSMQAFLDKNASFTPDADQRQIIPCSQGVGRPCEPMVAQIRAETQAYCLTAGMAGEKANYLLGQVQRISGSMYKQLGFDPAENPTGLLYLVVSNGKGIAVFPQADVTVGVKRNQSPYMGWRFQFGAEPDSSYTSARARWRRDNPHARGMAMEFRRTAAVRSGPADLLPDDADEAQLGDPDFGWMTCAAGCCQFHGTPPGGGNGDGDGHGHGHGGHGGHGGHSGRTRMNVAKDRP